MTDVALAAVTAAASLGALAVGGEQGARAPDAVGAALLVGAAVPLVVRRRWPLPSFGLQLVLVMTYLALQFPGGADLPVLLAGIYSIAAAGHRRWTLGLVSVIVGVGSLHRVLVEGENILIVLVSGSLLLLVALLGDNVSRRHALRAETRRRLAAAEAEQESHTRARVAEERLRIAHELHDVMAHTITTMTVQAGAARDQLSRDPQQAARALDDLRTAARSATSELRAIIAVLRDPDDPERAPTPRLSHLDELVHTTRRAGIRVDLDTDGVGSTALPSAVEVTAHRIVQEALTNVVRHADATTATVRLDATRSRLVVEVVDDGRGPNAATGPTGFGLIGLRERATALGGRLEAGPGPDGGFRVHAVLPT